MRNSSVVRGMNMSKTLVNSAQKGSVASVVSLFLALILTTSGFHSYPAHAATATIQSFSPNVASASGGNEIVVTGKSLDKITKVRVGGVVQTKLTKRTKTKFSFSVPRMSQTLRKYGGYVSVEFMQSGAWRKASPKFLVTAPRDVPFESAGLEFKLLETSQPTFVPQEARYGDLLPSPGAKLHGVMLNVLNMTDTWIDLTCSFEVDVRVIDSTFRRFTYVDDRYKIAGNPECNDFMNPGFSADALWVFDVPDRFKVVALEVKTVTWTGTDPRTYYFSF